MGVTQFELICLFMKKGIKTVVCDKRTEAELLQNYAKNYNALKELKVAFSLGENYMDAFDTADVIFRTPGMNFNTPQLMKARERGVVVTSEMEVFFDLCPCKIYAVTGSDGKTTSTTLISEFLKAQGKTVHLGGNIGRALLPVIETIQPDDIAVVELSSFQLISMRQSPDVAVVTNVAPNHLDVHKDMEEYVGAKTNIFRHQNAFSKTILNMDNVITNGFADQVRGELVWFSRSQPVPHGAYLDEDGMLCRVMHGTCEKIMHQDDIKLPGMHNVENYLTAISAVGDEVDAETIHKVAVEFGGVEHRIEYVRTLDGARYYNDSIATSPTRTIAGLDAFDRRLIVIAGGYDKNLAYKPLAPKLVEKVKVLVLLGATAPKIEQAVRECPDYAPEKIKMVHADSLEDAVNAARNEASEGDVVILSPASASFDMYLNFEQRGQHFKRIVNELK